MVAQRRIHPDETGFADLDAAGNDDVGGEEAMIANRRMMADMISAPQRHIVADGCERLDRVVLENKAVLAPIGRR